MHSTRYTSQFPLATLHPQTLLFTLSTFHAALYTLHSTLYTLHFTLYTVHPTLYTFHFTLSTFHSTLYTLHFILYTPHFTLHNPHFTLCTLHSTLYTPHFTLCTLYFTLHTLHSTIHTLHCTLHSTLYTPHFTLNTLHSTLYIPHSTLYTPHSTLHTFHFPLPFASLITLVPGSLSYVWTFVFKCFILCSVQRMTLKKSRPRFSEYTSLFRPLPFGFNSQVDIISLRRRNRSVGENNANFTMVYDTVLTAGVFIHELDQSAHKTYAGPQIVAFHLPSLSRSSSQPFLCCKLF